MKQIRIGLLATRLNVRLGTQNFSLISLLRCPEKLDERTLSRTCRNFSLWLCPVV
jgi:hypothetical protein